MQIQSYPFIFLSFLFISSNFYERESVANKITQIIFLMNFEYLGLQSLFIPYDSIKKYIFLDFEKLNSFDVLIFFT